MRDQGFPPAVGRVYIDHQELEVEFYRRKEGPWVVTVGGEELAVGMDLPKMVDVVRASFPGISFLTIEEHLAQEEAERTWSAHDFMDYMPREQRDVLACAIARWLGLDEVLKELEAVVMAGWRN